MILPVESAEEWAERYGLEVKEFKCGNCGKPQATNIPFAIKGYRGLMTETHECGKNFISSLAVPVGKSLEAIREVIS